jgi:DNA-binding transcriptional ArsR family regulator
MTEAWRSSQPTGRKLVLLSPCDNANDQGECYPSMARIAERCGMSERAAQGHVTELEKAGILSRQERLGRSTLYTIHPRRICTPAESAPPQKTTVTPAESAPTPAESAPTVPAESAPRIINEPSLEPSSNRQGARGAQIQSAIFKVDDVEKSVWQDFTVLRKVKKAPLTKTAVDGLRREAEKAGLTLEQAIRICCESGWAGFKAEWVAGKTTPANQPTETAYQKSKRLQMERDFPNLCFTGEQHGTALELG